MPHWASGDAASLASAGPSLVITRSLDSKEDNLQTFIPRRFVRGLLPEVLLESYVFWQKRDGSLLGQRRPPSAPSSGGSASPPSPPSAPSDELWITLSGGRATVRRVPLAGGAPQPAAATRLLAAMHAPRGGALAKLIALLERVDELSHVLLWSAAGDGRDAEPNVEVIELPRLRLTLEARRGSNGATRLYLREHPGLRLGAVNDERMRSLPRGLPHALPLLSEEGAF